MNSIRVPKQGVTATSRRIALAVDDEAWQKFRVSLKGISTQAKMMRLKEYWYDNTHNHDIDQAGSDCNVCIRVDNYIKALCRGGQLNAGESLQTALEWQFYLSIKKG